MRVAFSTLLAEGRPFLGTFIQSAAPEFVEAAGYAGFRFAAVDLEHTYYGPEKTAEMVRAVEAADLCGEDKSPEDCLAQLVAQFPQGKFVLTLGGQGCLYRDAHLSIHKPACPVQPVDTTAAGDTFTGFFIAGIAAGEDVSTALEEATKAAAIAISRKGAAPSIPSRAETLTYGG